MRGAFFCGIFVFCLQFVFNPVVVLANDNPRDTVRVAIWEWVNFLDPAYSTSSESIIIHDVLFQGLVRYVHNKITKADAASWEVSEGGKRYTFKLRDDIFWSDGEPVKANDYVLAFRRLLDKNVNLDLRPSYLTYPIKNAVKIKKGQAELETLGVSAPDDKTLVFDLETPSSFFIDVLAYPSLVPVPGHVVSKYGNEWFRRESLVSNGPYRLIKSGEDGSLLLEQGKVKRLPEAPRYISFSILKSAADAQHQVLAGKVDIVYSIRSNDLAWLNNRAGFKTIHRVEPGTFYAVFNLQNEKLRDVRVRRALSLSLDGKKIAAATGGESAITFAPPRMLKAGKDLLKYEYAGMDYAQRAQKARQLLAEAGYSEESPLELTILAVKRNTNYKATIAMRSMFSHIGVKTKMIEVEDKGFSKLLRAKNYDTSIVTWIADYNDAMTFYSILRTGASANISGFSNAEFEGLMDTALVEEDAGKRQQIYAKMENILREEVPIMPLMHSAETSIASTRLENPEDLINFSWLSVYDVRFVNVGE